MSNQHYLNNPLIHRDRRLGGHPSKWARQFDCTALRPLIICRGPVRKEAMDVFEEMGITGYGILLSEKDSIVYRNALAPELRALTDPERVHRVPDYTGANKEERVERIRQIISIAQDNGYNAVFAGYGFMAEDESMVAALEAAGLNFIGPCSRTVHGAGLKDEAKRTALAVGVSVTPGVDNGTALTLLKKHPDSAALKALCKQHGLDVPDLDVQGRGKLPLEAQADRVLAAAYAAGVDLYTIDELCATLTEVVGEMAAEYPRHRIRLKAIGGGGGKGQRILGVGEAGRTGEMVREILNEVKTTGVGDNKNVLVELNIETTRHQEIQVIGNGEWTLALGGRDCSLQMHEQKLLEVSVTQESLQRAIAAAKAGAAEAKKTKAGKKGADGASADQASAAQAGAGGAGAAQIEAGRTEADWKEEAAVLAQDLETLKAMEEESERFGAAVGLDSVSTFECIVDGDRHFFMEMNTRIQVEHRVTELCYALKFSNPAVPKEHFVVDSLVEAMVLLAAHGPSLPKPERVPRHNDTVEARLNATNHALQPHAGGVIEHWSDAVAGEVRDDQGISLHNPDTDTFMKYTLAGAYDSNIALLLTVGESRLGAYRNLAEVVRRTTMSGRDLATNLAFHYGLVNWFIGRNINARPTTRFILPYLTAVGELRARAADIDLEHAYGRMQAAALAAVETGGAQGDTKGSAGANVDTKGNGKDAAKDGANGGAGAGAKGEAKGEEGAGEVGAEDAAARWREAFERKHTLLLRPLERLLDEPHLLSGWLSVNRGCCTISDGKVRWHRNPVQVLADTYHFLNMDYGDQAAAAARERSHQHGHDDQGATTGRPAIGTAQGNNLQHGSGDKGVAAGRSAVDTPKPRPAASMIWDHDQQLLQAAVDFYRELEQRLGIHDWAELQALLAAPDAPAGFNATRGKVPGGQQAQGKNLREDAAPEGALQGEPTQPGAAQGDSTRSEEAQGQVQWDAVRAAHAGFQCGLDIIAVLPALAEQTDYYALTVNPDLTIHIPERLLDPDLQARMTAALAPPPVASGNEILAESGGMFYSREAPDAPPFVAAGSHFERGDPLYIVEVMKMFNKVYAPFAGTIDQVLVGEDGVIISKGQPLFSITPDEVVEEESPQDRQNRRRTATEALLKSICGTDDV